MTTFLHRLTGVALLNSQVFEEIEADRSATIQALWVVMLSSVAAGIGTVNQSHGRVSAFVTISLLALAVWSIWTFLTLQIGTRLLPSPQTEADYAQLLRTIGFATAPGILRAVGAVPGTTTAVFAITAVWMLMAMIVAVRQTLEYTTTARAFAVCAVGWLLTMGLVVAIGILWSPEVS
jgi:hypothetical protein